MKLYDLLEDYKKIINKKNLEINSFSYDSRKAKEGDLFFALKGKTTDGHLYITDAYKNGARAFVIEDTTDYMDDACYIVVDDSRKSLSKLSSKFFSEPSNILKVIGITGTKGKTTTANYIYEILNSLSIPTGIIGTNGVFYNNKTEEIVNTTPESYELHKIFSDMVKSGIKFVVMEVSSQALMLERVEDVDFDLVIFTNLHRDHIGPKEHKNFKEYFDAKMKLFSMSPVAIINEDDHKIYEASKNINIKLIGVSLNHNTDYYATNIYLSTDLLNPSTKFLMNGIKYELPTIGIFNIYNAIMMIAAIEYFGIKSNEYIPELKNIKVKGRMELIPVENRIFVLDYAHNKISLEETLKTLNKYKNNGKIITVVGSVGGRSKERRKELAEISSAYSDISIFTSDNPDFEDPLSICLEMKSFYTGKNQAIVEPDRQKSIHLAYSISNENDIILVAGKGHEEYQIIQGEYIHYSDKETIKNIMENI